MDSHYKPEESICCPNLSISPVPFLSLSLINFVFIVTLPPCTSLMSNGAKSFADNTIFCGV